GHEAQRVAPAVRVVHVRDGVRGGSQAQRVGGGVAAGLGVVVAEVVVVEAGLGVVVLAGEAERGVGTAVTGPGRGAPERAPGAPGDVARRVDAERGGADEVGGDGEEPPGDLLLAVVGPEDALGLGEGDGDGGVRGEGRRGRDVTLLVGLVAGLFARGEAVPGEPGLLGHTGAVGRQALFRDAAAQRVVAVGPAGAVGGGDGGEAVLRVPRVAPGVGLAGEAGLLPQGDPAEGVVLEADVSGTGDAGAAVGPLPGRLTARMPVRPGR